MVNCRVRLAHAAPLPDLPMPFCFFRCSCRCATHNLYRYTINFQAAATPVSNATHASGTFPARPLTYTGTTDMPAPLNSKTRLKWLPSGFPIHMS